MKKCFFYFLVFTTCCSCIEEAQIPFRSESVKLVIDGGITNEIPPYTLRLTYSGNLKAANFVNLNLAVTGAKVIVTDDLGKSVEFKPSPYERGVYRSVDDAYIGQIGRSYALNVGLKDGRTYISKPQKLLPCPKIDSLYEEYQDIVNSSTPDGYQVYLDTKDPAETQNYYRWSAYGYSLVGGICGDGLCDVFCWVPRFQTKINTLSDNFINGNPIKKRPVFFSPVYGVGKHFVEVTQFAISREAYQFWQLYDEQTSRTGTIFDPLPAPIQGNVFNANDSNDFALGYFGVSGVSRKRLIIYGQYNRTAIFINARNFLPQGGGCSLPFASLDRPDGWPRD